MTPRTAEKPLHVLVVSNMYPAPGNPVFGTFVQRQVRGLESAGARVTVVANDDPTTGASASARKYLRLLVRARAAARRVQPDIVVGHFLYPTAGIAASAARVARVPLVLVSHGSDVTSIAAGGRLARWARAAMDDAALVVAVSSALERSIRTDLALAPQIPTAVVNMGIDTDRFHPRRDARAQLGWAAEERVALFAGNLVPVKGVDVLIAAFALLRGRNAADRLFVVGEGPLAAQLAEQAATLGVADRIEFTGRMAADDLALHAAAADVFVLPSRMEGLGLVLAEALASGTPCVASRVGGTAEVVSVPECGRLVPSEDPGALADAVAEVLELGKERFSAACIARGVEFDFRACAASFLKAIEEVAP